MPNSWPLTHEQIDALLPGPECDEAVALARGWKHDDLGSDWVVQLHSTDRNAALDLLKELSEDSRFCVWGRTCELFVLGMWSQFGEGETQAHAICLAYLHWKAGEAANE